MTKYGELGEAWFDSEETPNGVPVIVRRLCSMITAMEIELRNEEFTHDEAIRIICAWLKGGCRC